MISTRKLTIFYDQHFSTYIWLSFLLYAKSSLRAAGLDVQIYGGFVDSLSENKRTAVDLEKIIEKKHYDIIGFAFHNSSTIYNNEPELAQLLTIAKVQSNKIVWFDTSDSCGSCQFQVLPFVDKYLKKQLYKDFSLYQRKVWGNRIFFEYYHNAFGATDEKISTEHQCLLKDEYAYKIALSWNVGLGDYLSPRFYKIFDSKRFHFLHSFVKPSENRSIDLHFRGSQQGTVVGFQRRLVMNQFQIFSGIKTPNEKADANHKQYLCELKDSKSVVSPFGWGEICLRDFEAFVYGCILIKPDMSHVDTFPQYYIPYQTYIPMSWDVSDLSTIALKIHNEYDDLSSIANKAQQLYRRSLSKQGQDDFAQHIAKEIL